MADSSKDGIFGAVTVGERGQIVIPAEIRKKFKIRAGDKLIVFARENSIGLVPSGVFHQFLSQATQVMEKIGK